jgi:hypothetical protein
MCGLCGPVLPLMPPSVGRAAEVNNSRPQLRIIYHLVVYPRLTRRITGTLILERPFKFYVSSALRPSPPSECRLMTNKTCKTMINLVTACGTSTPLNTQSFVSHFSNQLFLQNNCSIRPAQRWRAVRACPPARRPTRP